MSAGRLTVKEIMQLRNTFALAVLLGMTGAIVQGQEQLNKRHKPDGEEKVGPWQKQEPSVDQQKENASVRVLTKHIRSSIVKDKSLSSHAHNVKVIASWHGTVTLKGPVSSDEEKREVEMKAFEIAGPDNVNTEIFVAAKTELDRSK